MRTLAAAVFLLCATTVSASDVFDDLPGLELRKLELARNAAAQLDANKRVELINATYDDFVTVMSPLLEKPISYDPSALGDRRVTMIAEVTSSKTADRLLRDLAVSQGLAVVDLGSVTALVPIEDAESGSRRISGVYKLAAARGEKIAQTAEKLGMPASLVVAGDQIAYSVPVHRQSELLSLLRSLDVPEQTMTVEAVLFESTRADLEKLGITAELDGAGATITAIASDFVGSFSAAFSRGPLSLVVDALTSETDARVLAMPSLTVTPGETGRVLVGQDVPVLIGQAREDDGALFNQVERREVGTSLEITPTMAGGRVLLRIDQEVSSVAQSTAGTDLTIDTRRIGTAATVQPGELLYLGGLIGSASDRSERRVPYLSSLPGIGGLFRYKSSRSSDQVLSLLVRVRPSAEMYPELAQLPTGTPSRQLSVPSGGHSATR